jgi:hypothetical protein
VVETIKLYALLGWQTDRDSISTIKNLSRTILTHTKDFCENNAPTSTDFNNRFQQVAKI